MIDSVQDQPETEFNEIGGLPNPTQELRRVLLFMLQSYFAQQTLTNDIQWDPDPKKTGIFITDVHPSDIESFDPRPAIVLQRGPFRRQTLAVGDDKVTEDLRQAIETNTWIVSGNMIFNCISQHGLEAESLAWVVHDLVVMYCRQIAARVPLHNLGNSTIGDEKDWDPTGQGVPDKGNWANVPVSIEFHLNRTVTTQITPIRTLDGVFGKQQI